VLRLDGTCGDASGEFLIAVGKAAHEKHRFSIGMEVGGVSMPVPDPRLETAGFYSVLSASVRGAIFFTRAGSLVTRGAGQRRTTAGCER
jgi:hypothetical protein